MKKLKNASVENVDVKLLWDTKETTKADVSDHRVSTWRPLDPPKFRCSQIIIPINYYLTKILRRKRIIREHRQRRY